MPLIASEQALNGLSSTSWHEDKARRSHQPLQSKVDDLAVQKNIPHIRNTNEASRDITLLIEPRTASYIPAKDKR